MTTINTTSCDVNSAIVGLNTSTGSYDVNNETTGSINNQFIDIIADFSNSIGDNRIRGVFDGIKPSRGSFVYRLVGGLVYGYRKRDLVRWLPESDGVLHEQFAY